METVIFILDAENLKAIYRNDRGWENIKFKGEDNYDFAADPNFTKGIDYIKNRLHLEETPFLTKEIIIVYSLPALPLIGGLVSAITPMKGLEVISASKAAGLFAEYSGLLNESAEVKLKFNNEVFSVSLDPERIVVIEKTEEKEDQTINLTDIGLIAEPRKINQYSGKEETKGSLKSADEIRFDLVKMLDLKV